MSKHPKVLISDLIIYEPKKSVKEQIGKKYGRFRIISFAGKKVSKSAVSIYYNCKCDCGNEVIVSSGHLKGGKTRSCGCISIEHPNRTVHGYAPLKGRREKIYTKWQGMHKRCKPSKNKSSRKYLEKGIKVCNGWSGSDGFINFKNDMMPITDKSLDRIDNDLHYSCGKCDECIKNGWILNVRWANDDIQSNNRGDFNNWITIDGVKMTFRQADRYLGFPIKTIQGRIKSLGWSIEKSISTPITNNKTRHLYKHLK